MGPAPDNADDSALDYSAYVKIHKKEILVYAGLRDDQASEEYLLAHPQLLHEHAEGYMLLMALDAAMKGEDEKTKAVSRQYELVNYVLEVAKTAGGDRDVLAAVKPFFARVRSGSSKYLDGFDKDVDEFVKKLRNRAQEKLSKGEESP